MADSNLQRIGEHVFKRLGFVPTDLLYQRLGRVIHVRMKHRGILSMGEYLTRLEAVSDEELEHLSQALTINETYFFREPKHFDAVATLLPTLIKPADPIRLLSVGCATGEEAYSLAITASRALAGPRPNLEVVGADIDAVALGKAREGLYDPWSFREDGLALAEGFIRPEGAKLRVRPQLRQLVRFQQMNLLQHTPTGLFQVIFCRNMLMYLAPDHRRDILSRLTDLLPAGGVLFTSATEIVQDLPTGLERVYGQGTYYYRRKVRASSVRPAASSQPAVRVALASQALLFRKTVREILREEDGLEVVAESGEFPLSRTSLAENRPDLVVLDGALYAASAVALLSRPDGDVPVLVVAGPGSDARPAQGVDMLSLAGDDAAALKAAGPTLVRRIQSALRPPPSRPASGLRPGRIVAIGCSTGGPAAVTEILQGLPAGLGLAFLVVQHMPAGFTASFAERLDRVTPLRVLEATSGAPLLPDVAYVAPGQYNLLVGPGSVVRVTGPEPNDIYVPNINRTFVSLEAAGLAGRTLAIVLTGMGNDGAQGLAVLAAAGAKTVVQDPAEAVIPGMVKAAIERGAAQKIAKLTEITQEIVRWAKQPSSNGSKTRYGAR